MQSKPSYLECDTNHENNLPSASEVKGSNIYVEPKLTKNSDTSQLKWKQNFMKLLVNKYMPSKNQKLKKTDKQKKFARPLEEYSDRAHQYKFAQPYKNSKHGNKILKNFSKDKSNKAVRKTDDVSRKRNILQTSDHPGKRRTKKDISYKRNELSRYFFTGTEVLILLSVSVLLTSAFVCCLGLVVHSGICEKKSRPTGDFKVDKWWANQNSSRIFFHLARSKPASSDGTSCKWSRSSKQKIGSKIICQCSSTNTSNSIAF
ncbi:hypothetical protein AVEN_88822-1 [Araneus ventricosus]|uniref:Uncharacterized protein n=1 Tax=Araneus ventricosus TaxID=182803 RepID=A0A4Y2S4H8_ARAVE|nr:hypothetical protein AVEN_251019-1 [Araneus ventricosus]GBN82881.1 hypothetical protein AVEN_88822-1 [Araneus ventricosus]